jgi:hypothetical protein
MMDRIESQSNRVVCLEPQGASSTRQPANASSRVRGITIVAVLACLVGMAAFVWVADRLWGSVGMGVLLVLSLTTAFALPELLLIAFAQVQGTAEDRDAPGDVS